ncbi:hypothetical protein AAMO2058_001353600 [Amorphochlora amoebiformis]
MSLGCLHSGYPSNTCQTENPAFQNPMSTPTPIAMDSGKKKKKPLMNDAKAFKQMNYWEQWDAMARHCVHNGFLEHLPLMLLHLLWATFVCTVLYYICDEKTRFAYSQTLDGYSGSKGFGGAPEIIQKAIIVYYPLEYFALAGTYSGPMYGNVVNPFPYFWYRFMPGSIKEPFHPIFGGKRRTIVDVVINLAFAQNTVYLLLCPSPLPKQGIYLQFFICFVIFFFDYGGSTGSLGCMNIPLVFAAAADAYTDGKCFLTGCQVVLFMVYVGCGIGKMGPWFVRQFSLEWTLPPPFSPFSIFKKLFFVNHDAPLGAEDYNPTPLAKAMGYVAASTEWGAPLLLLLSPFSMVVTAGVITLIAMHVYIIFHLPFGDINLLNTFTGAMLYHAYSGATCGFDYTAFWNIPQWYKVILCLHLVLVVYAQIHVDEISYFYAYRFWAGNWPHGFYVIDRKKGLPKLHNVKAVEEVPPVGLKTTMSLNLVPSPWHIERFTLVYMGAFFIGQFQCRYLPYTLYKAMAYAKNKLENVHADGKRLSKEDDMKLTDPLILHCVSGNLWASGVCGNCALRSYEILPELQKECKFAPGEAVYVQMNSFPVFGSRATWQIFDLGLSPTVPVESGVVLREVNMEIRKPSDCKAFVCKREDE